MKKGLLFVFGLFLGFGAWGQYKWDGDNPLGNFSYCTNWYGDLCPDISSSFTDLEFHNVNNSAQTSIYFDYGSWKTLRSILYMYTIPKSIDFNGDVTDGIHNGFDIYFKVENNSDYSQTLTIPLSVKGTAFEMNPIKGGLTFTNTIFNGNNKNYFVWGNNGKKLTLSGSPRGNTFVKLFIKQNSIVEIKYNDTNTFSGGVDVEIGELWIAANAALNGGVIKVGSENTNYCKVYISDNSIATSVSNSIEVPSNSSNSTIGSLNATNTHIYSGTINLNNNNVKLDAVNNGSFLISNTISGTGGSVNKIGPGTTILSGANSYDNNTTITSGTLAIGDGGTSGSIVGNVANNANLLFNRSDDYSFAGNITGNGNVSKSGTGKLTLSGTNTYSGNTTVTAGTLEITGSIDCNVLTVESGATLIVNGTTVKMSKIVNNGTVLVRSGKTLIVTNEIENRGTIEVENNASVYQINDVTSNNNSNSGIINVYRNTSTFNQYDYTYFSSPIEAETVTDALSNFSPLYFYDAGNYLDLYSASATGGTGFPQTGGTPDGFDDNNDDWQTATGVMTPGVGYIARGNTAPITGVQVKFSANGNDGRFNNGQISITLEKDGFNEVSPPTDVPATGTTIDDYKRSNNNANLIGNPYPSALSLIELYNDNSSLLTGSFYLWTHNSVIGSGANTGPWAYNYNTNDFASYNVLGTPAGVAASTGGATPNGFASTGQGFIASVKEDASSFSLNFNNTQRGESFSNDQFFKAISKDLDRIWLNFTAPDGESIQTFIGFENGATKEYDLYDTQRMENGNANDFYSFPNVENPMRLVIQRLEPFESDKLVPLGMEITSTGNALIALDHAEGIFNQGQAIYLEDTYQNVIHDLSASAYSFTQTAGNDINDRFVLRFTKSALSNEEVSLQDIKLYPNPVKEVLNIYNPTGETLDVQVYDATGKLIQSKHNAESIHFANFARGWYVIKLTGTSGTVTQKIILD